MLLSLDIGSQPSVRILLREQTYFKSGATQK